MQQHQDRQLRKGIQGAACPTALIQQTPNIGKHDWQMQLELDVPMQKTVFDIALTPGITQTHSAVNRRSS